MFSGQYQGDEVAVKKMARVVKCSPANTRAIDGVEVAVNDAP